MKNIKGMEMALSTVITLILILIVLVVVASFFLGGTEAIFNPLKNLTNQTASKIAEGGKLIGST